MLTDSQILVTDLAREGHNLDMYRLHGHFQRWEVGVAVGRACTNITVL